MKFVNQLRTHIFSHHHYKCP